MCTYGGGRIYAETTKKCITHEFAIVQAVPGYNMVWAFLRRKYVGGLGVMAILAFTMIFGAMIVETFVPELLPTVAGSPSK